MSAEIARPPKRPRDEPLAIDTLFIGAFRGLRNVKLERLSRINLLVGANNAGKTSILEAAAILQNPFDPFEWLNVVRARETRAVGIYPDQMSIIESLRWIFPAREGDVWGEQAPLPITLQSIAAGATDQLEINCEVVRGVVDPKQVRRVFSARRVIESEPVEDSGLLLKATASLEQGMLMPVQFSRDWTIWSQFGLRPELRQERPRENVQFLPPYAHRNSSANLRRLTTASRIGARDDIDALLRDLDPRIAGVEIITSEDGRFPKIAIRLRNGILMPQGVLGDGVRRALSIALGLRAASNGLLLIDEIEAALHVSALDRVYRWLDGAVSSFSVQIFATTHSLEAIDAIIRSTSPDSHSDLSGYTLDENEESGVKRYTGGMLHRLVHQRGLDIRG
jgi:putative AbiEii toxin of type IV toxin-antitoxin system